LSLARRAAVLGLLHAALDDLRRQVATVELADRRHDAVQQQARWCLVDVLGHRHQFGTGLSDRQVDRHVIGAVAREAINLVHDHVADWMLGNELEHSL
jgi:hypothetical protein